MLKLNDIIDLIKVNQTPHWTLSARKNSYTNTKEFKGNSPENETEDIDLAISKLKELTNYLKNEMVHCYSIDTKYKKSSNKAGILTYEFILNENQQNNQQNNNQSLNGMGGPPDGFVSLGQLDAMLKTERALGEVTLQKMMLEKEREDFERQKKERMEDLDKQKEYFNSDVNKAAKGFWVLGNYVFGELFKGAPEALGKVEIRENKSLPEDIVNDEFTESEKVAAEIATKLSETYKSPEEMKKMKYFIDTFIDQQKNPPTQENKENNENKTDNE
jgi:hypothetical protein